MWCIYLHLCKGRVSCIFPDVPLVQVDIGLLADQVGVTTTDTLDLGQGVHDLFLSIDVGVEETENELEVRLLTRYESCVKGERENVSLKLFQPFLDTLDASIFTRNVHMLGDL